MAESTNISSQNAKAVGLGFGTLIIIALIVLFLGRANLTPLEVEIAGLRTDVQALQADINTLRLDLRPKLVTPDAGP